MDRAEAGPALPPPRLASAQQTFIRPHAEDTAHALVHRKGSLAVPLPHAPHAGR